MRINCLKTLLGTLLATLLCSPVIAQDPEEAAATVERKAKTATLAAEPAARVEKAPMRLKSKPASTGPDSIASPDGGGVLTLCCGSVDPHEMTGSNCAYMHTGQGCAGYILACPEGSKDTVKENGDGYCKQGG